MRFSPQPRAIFAHQNFKSVPKLTCFVHFDLWMCFAPQRRAIFRHRKYKKRFGPEVFYTFSLVNGLLATTACNFWFLCCAATPAPAAVASLLFEHQEPRTIEKTQHVATSLTSGACESSFFWLSRYYIFVLLTLLQLICFVGCSILSEVYYLNFLR